MIQTIQNPSNFNITSGLVHYWPFNGNFKDMINGSDLIYGANGEFTSNKYFKLSSAYYLKNGYLSLPPNIYIQGSYTVMSWVRVISITQYIRLFEVGTSSSYITFLLSNTNSLQLINALYISLPTDVLGMCTQTKLTLNKWTHVAFVLNTNLIGYIYIDGVKVNYDKTSTQLPQALTRNMNYIGRSRFYPYDPDANFVIDDLKIFNRGLSLTEILYEMNNNV